MQSKEPDAGSDWIQVRETLAEIGICCRICYYSSPCWCHDCHDQPSHEDLLVDPRRNN
ncbi:hypothetical protein IGI04_007805 [Brassica rapa subsp. trilocularis]|uniref:Uncharacterized protein n=1 Tax=Brassica rapa subsp. trilocularis TaxID=1813537 RepID=A0ABQ7NMU6_BRACM|nr:hypothetical protein IGI04_007805 [Brassica rapa subsp. trilocularis]